MNWLPLGIIVALLAVIAVLAPVACAGPAPTGIPDATTWRQGWDAMRYTAGQEPYGGVHALAAVERANDALIQCEGKGGHWRMNPLGCEF